MRRQCVIRSRSAAREPCARLLSFPPFPLPAFTLRRFFRRGKPGRIPSSNSDRSPAAMPAAAERRKFSARNDATFLRFTKFLFLDVDSLSIVRGQPAQSCDSMHRWTALRCRCVDGGAPAGQGGPLP